VVDQSVSSAPSRRTTFRSAGTRSTSACPQVSVRTSCRVVRRALSLALREDGCAGTKYSDTFHGVRCLSTKSVPRIVGAPTCLTGAIRSQGFSPSQRFKSPRDLVALFHATSVRRLLGLQSFFHSASRGVSRHPVLSCRPDLGTLRTEVHLVREELRLQSLAPTEHSSPVLTEVRQAAALLAFLLFEACRSRLRDRSPPLSRFTSGRSAVHGRPSSSCAPGYYSRAWKRLGESSQPP